MDLRSAWHHWFGRCTPQCRGVFIHPQRSLKEYPDCPGCFTARTHTHTNRKEEKNTFKGIFSSLLMSPPQSAHPCWEANVIPSAFPVSSPHVAWNEPETQRHSSKMTGKTQKLLLPLNKTWYCEKEKLCNGCNVTITKTVCTCGHLDRLFTSFSRCFIFYFS